MMLSKTNFALLIVIGLVGISSCASNSSDHNVPPSSTIDVIATLQTKVLEIVEVRLTEALANQPTLTQNVGEAEFRNCVTSFSMNNARSIFESKRSTVAQQESVDISLLLNESIFAVQGQIQQILQMCSQQ